MKQLFRNWFCKGHFEILCDCQCVFYDGSSAIIGSKATFCVDFISFASFDKNMNGEIWVKCLTIMKRTMVGIISVFTLLLLIAREIWVHFDRWNIAHRGYNVSI